MATSQPAPGLGEAWPLSVPWVSFLWLPFKLPLTESLKAMESYPLSVLEARSLKSRYQQGWFWDSGKAWGHAPPQHLAAAGSPQPVDAAPPSLLPPSHQLVSCVPLSQISLHLSLFTLIFFIAL